MLLPESVRYDINRCSSWLKIRAADAAAKLHGHFEQRKETRCNADTLHVLGDIAAGQIGISALNGGELLESLTLFTPVPEIRGVSVHAVVVLLGNGFPDGDNPIEMGERKRAEQHRVHRAERSGVGADAQRQ